MPTNRLTHERLSIKASGPGHADLRRVYENKHTSLKIIKVLP